MTRRDAMKWLTIAAGGSLVASGGQAPIQKFGYVDVSRAHANGWHPARVLLNDIDVSDDCQALDDVGGYVVLMKKNADGKHYAEHEVVAKETRYGSVIFVPKGQQL